MDKTTTKLLYQQITELRRALTALERQHTELRYYVHNLHDNIAAGRGIKTKCRLPSAKEAIRPTNDTLSFDGQKETKKCNG